jgi:hypothetical protein
MVECYFIIHGMKAICKGSNQGDWKAHRSTRYSLLWSACPWHNSLWWWLGFTLLSLEEFLDWCLRSKLCRSTALEVLIEIRNMGGLHFMWCKADRDWQHDDNSHRGYLYWTMEFRYIIIAFENVTRVLNYSEYPHETHEISGAIFTSSNDTRTRKLTWPHLSIL